MKNKYTVISFASKEPAIYADCAERLAASCARFSIQCDVQIVDFSGAHRRDIVLHKPTYILDALNRHKSPVLWLDCDSDIETVLHDELPPGDWDVGFAPNPFLNWRLKLGGLLRRNKRPEHRNPVTGFASAFRYTQSAIKFLENWKYLCDWPDFAPGGDHIRMSWARQTVSLRECNLASFLNRKVIINSGRRKESIARWSVWACYRSIAR